MPGLNYVVEIGGEHGPLVIEQAKTAVMSISAELDLVLAESEFILLSVGQHIHYWRIKAGKSAIGLVKLICRPTTIIAAIR